MTYLHTVEGEEHIQCLSAIPRHLRHRRVELHRTLWVIAEDSLCSRLVSETRSSVPHSVLTSVITVTILLPYRRYCTGYTWYYCRICPMHTLITVITTLLRHSLVPTIVSFSIQSAKSSVLYLYFAGSDDTVRYSYTVP